MRILLDTHALLWWLDGDPRLSARARRAIAVHAELPAILRQQVFEPLPISIAHAQRAGNLPGSHRDPFDRMLVGAGPRGRSRSGQQRAGVRSVRRATIW